MLDGTLYSNMFSLKVIRNGGPFAGEIRRNINRIRLLKFVTLPMAVDQREKLSGLLQT